MLVKLALQILCKFWGEAGQYLSYICDFITRQPWDDDEDARQMAISIAGEFLRAEKDHQLLSALITIVKDDDEDDFTRQDAYLSLSRAMGRDWNELPQLSRLPPLEKLIDKRLVGQARTRLADE